MAASSRRAVLTGIGVLNAIGLDHSSVWTSLSQGRGGIRPIQTFDASGLPVRIAGEIPSFDGKAYLEKEQRKGLRMMARPIQLAVAAAQKALEDARINPKKDLDPTRFGVEFGSGLMATDLTEIADAASVSATPQPGVVDLHRWGEKGLPVIQPLWMLKYLPNMMACHISILHDAQGPNNTITESDVASLLALSEAYHIVRRNGADFMLVGGAESKLNPLSMVRQCLFEPLSHRNDDPAHACRPFDRDRDGLVLGEGGTVLALEDLEHARRRGARIYAEVTGVGASFDSGRSGQGVVRAISAALRMAQIAPSDVDHINAHGLASIPSDLYEARGLYEVFGKCQPTIPVFAPKSYIGNLGAGGGVAELAASVLAMHHGQLPGTLNHEHPDPECPVTVHTGAPRPVQRDHFVKVGFTQNGQCAAVVIKRIPGEG